MMCAISGICQQLPPRTEEQLENHAMMTEETAEDDQLLLQLDYFRKHQLDLNTADADALRSLGILTDLQVDHIIDYRKLMGKFISIYELQAVPGLDVGTIRKILPFVRLGDAVTVGKAFSARFDGAHSWLLRTSTVLERKEGYRRDSGQHYAGSPFQLLARYRYQYRNELYAGIVAEKDAGEQLFRGAQKSGFDFYSVHLFARNVGIVKAIAVGDYTLNLGQGLIQWQSMGFGKSAEVMSVKRQSPVLAPYRAAGEFYFNRGLAFTAGRKHWESSFYFSARRLSANLKTDTISYFTALQTSGYHRTASEVEERGKLGLLSYGGSFSFKTNRFKVSLNTVASRFSLPMIKADEPYNRFAMRGDKWKNASIDYQYTYRNVHLFGEAAIAGNGSRALLQGALISVDPKADLSLVFRKIDPAYQSVWGNAFAESSTPSNEQGAFIGLSLRPVWNVTINAYADYYRFPWIRFRIHAPVESQDYLVRIQYIPDKRTELVLRYRHEVKPQNLADETMPYPVPVVRGGLRLQLAQAVANWLTIRSRVEMAWYKKGGEREEGFLGYIEGMVTVSSRMQVDLRCQYFETGSYETRIYAYEQDVLYGFSLPPNYGKGLRYYINTSYKVSKKLAAWLKWSRTVSGTGEGFGSGLEQIEGDHKTEIRFQLRYVLD